MPKYSARMGSRDKQPEIAENAAHRKKQIKEDGAGTTITGEPSEATTSKCKAAAGAVKTAAGGAAIASGASGNIWGVLGSVAGLIAGVAIDAFCG